MSTNETVNPIPHSPTVSIDVFPMWENKWKDLKDIGHNSLLSAVRAHCLRTQCAICLNLDFSALLVITGEATVTLDESVINAYPIGFTLANFMPRPQIKKTGCNFYTQNYGLPAISSF